jgi:hypothetical protein
MDENSLGIEERKSDLEFCYGLDMVYSLRLYGAVGWILSMA